MTQIRFSISDSDALKHSSKVLSEIAKQMTDVIEEAPALVQHPGMAYRAVANLGDIALTLSNWAAVLESRAIEEIVRGESSMPVSRLRSEVQH